MIEIGRLCVKTAGRDARRKCVVIDVLENSYVMVDGQTRRRKVNIAHLEPINQVIKIKKGASHEEVSKAFEELGLETRTSTPKEKTERPRKVRKVKEKPEPKKKKAAKKGEKADKPAKAEKKEEKPKEEKPAKEEKKDDKTAVKKESAPEDSKKTEEKKG
jgi:large subunit ribosomal protein L14e